MVVKAARKDLAQSKELKIPEARKGRLPRNPQEDIRLNCPWQIVETEPSQAPLDRSKNAQNILHTNAEQIRHLLRRHPALVHPQDVLPKSPL